jgi:NodT family efflux transporter outer membrane factor (OMF) lipoprotein
MSMSMQRFLGMARHASVRILPLSLAVALAGCAVGPDYRGAPDVAHGSVAAGSFVRAPAKGVSNAPTTSAWWTALGDARLDALIDAALAHNADLAAAQARLRQARAGLQKQKAAELPTIGSSASAIRMGLPSGTGGLSLGSGPLQLYSVGFDASWELDLFGGTRRAIQSSAAQAGAAEANLADTQVSLTAEVALAYVNLRDGQQRLALARQSAEAEEKLLELVRQRQARGVAADADVERQSAQVQTTRASLIPLDEQINESLNQLAVLTGRAPGELDDELAAPAPLPTLPAQVAVGDPAALLRQRPDIRAAERRLAASTAEIGEHVADYFPKVSLLGFIGSAAADPGNLTRHSNMTWVGAPYLTWNLFDFGRTRAAVHNAQAKRDEAEANYTTSVLTALQDANNALSRYGHQRDSVDRLTQVRVSADRSAALMSQRYAAGASSMIDLLDTQRTQFSAQQNLAQAQAELAKDFIALQKSLGLGWQAE